MKLSKIALAVTLSFTMLVAGCSVSQFDAVLNEIAPAISTVLQIIAISRGTTADLTVATKVAKDVTTLETLYNDYQSVSSTSKPGVESQINAGFTVLNQDISSVLAVAQVNDPATQQKIEALITLVQTGVGIAEAAIPSNSLTAQTARFRAKKLNASDLADSYNKILVAKTGTKKVDDFTAKAHKIHVHNEFERLATFGKAK
jgi:hypothetical protein